MTENLKIAVVTPWFGEFAGGAEVLAKGIAIELNKRGIETIVLTTCCKSPYSDWWNDFYEAGEHYVYEVKTLRYEVNKNTKQNYEKAINRFINDRDKMSDKEKSDFFVCGINSDALVEDIKSFLDDRWEIITLPYFQGLAHSVINAYPEKVNLVPCFHDESPFYWYPVKLILENCKNIFYNSKEEKAMTIKQYGHTIGKKVIEGCVSGVGIEKIISDDKPSIFLPNQKYFVYMGRKEIGKNVHLLINWFREFKNNYKGIVFLYDEFGKAIDKGLVDYHALLGFAEFCANSTLEKDGTVVFIGTGHKGFKNHGNLGDLDAETLDARVSEVGLQTQGMEDLFSI